MLAMAAVAFVGVAVFIIMMTIFQDEGSYQVQEKLEDNLNKQDYGKHGMVFKYSRPFFRRYVTPIVTNMKNKRWIKDKYKRKIATAGLTEVLSPEDFFSFKVFLILGFPIAFMGLREFLGETWPVSYIPFIAIIGYFYPDVWLRSKIQKRQKEILMSMPFSVDMLALSVEAGLDFVAAMTKVIEKAKPGPLTDEYEIFLKEIKVGASRAEGLRNLAWRVNMIQVSSFCATLIAADSVGANIGPILKGLSNEIRQKRSTEVEKAGATAATKILFPMMIFIVPAVFIMVMSPLIIEFVAR